MAATPDRFGELVFELGCYARNEESVYDATIRKSCCAGRADVRRIVIFTGDPAAHPECASVKEMVRHLNERANIAIKYRTFETDVKNFFTIMGKLDFGGVGGVTVDRASFKKSNWSGGVPPEDLVRFVLDAGFPQKFFDIVKATGKSVNALTRGTKRGKKRPAATALARENDDLRAKLARLSDAARPDTSGDAAANGDGAA